MPNYRGFLAELLMAECDDRARRRVPAGAVGMGTGLRDRGVESTRGAH